MVDTNKPVLVTLYPGLVEPVPPTFPEPSLESKWHQPWSEPPVKAKPGLLASAQQFFTISPFPVPATVNVVTVPFSDPVRLKQGLGAQYQQFIAYDPYPFTPPISGWLEPFFEVPKPKQGLASYLQQALAYTEAAPFPEAVLESKWHQAWSNPQRLDKPGLAAAYQQFTTFFTPLTQAPADSWFAPFSEPIVKSRPFQTSLQQYLAYSESAQFPETVMESKFHQPWSEPVRFKPGLASYLQQALAEQNVIAAPAPPLAWFEALSEPSVKAKIGLQAQLQQNPAFVALTPGLTVDSWFEALSEPKRFPKGLAVHLQRFLFTPDEKPPAVTISVTMSTTEIDTDVFSAGIVAMGGGGGTSNTPVSAYVSITEIPNGGQSLTGVAGN